MFGFHKTCVSAAAITTLSGSTTLAIGIAVSALASAGTTFLAPTPPAVPLPATGYMLMAGNGEMLAMRTRRPARR